MLRGNSRIAQENGQWTAVDDRTHDCWVETFPERQPAIDWLSGKFEMSEYHERQAAPKIEIENNAPAGRTFSIYQLKNDESTRPFKFEGKITAHYVDSFGFENLPEFAQAIEDKQQEIDVASYEKYQGMSQDSRRHEETLDSVKFDNDIDLDREKARDQLGFKDQTAAPAQPQKK